jgi:8-oxo-dGTP pyrophosphatase MutT (NUDIX family)
VGADDRGAPQDPGGAVSRTPRNPWVRRSRRTEYRNAWIEVFHDEVVRPDGSDGIYGVVHFHERAVGVVAVSSDGRILLVGQHRYTLDRYSWEIPEGGVPIDEDPLDGAKRELIEETGYTAARWRLMIPSLSLSNSVGDQTGCVFVASGLRPGPANPEPSEEIELRWVTIEEAIDMIDEGRIDDSVSQAALLRYALEERSGHR